jgi:endoribonuclease Dicer
MDDFLVVKELNAKFFDHSIIERHLHAAISAPSAGIEFDYERLELLGEFIPSSFQICHWTANEGDAFLKYLSSVYVFVTYPAQHEGALHVARQKIISNKSLLQNACSVGLPPYIQAKPFTLRLWQPPNFSVLPNPGPTTVKKEPTEEVELIYEADHDGKPSVAERTAQNVEPETPSTRSTAADKPTKKSKKKKKQDEQHTQTLGDKVWSFVAVISLWLIEESNHRQSQMWQKPSSVLPISQVVAKLPWEPQRLWASRYLT